MSLWAEAMSSEGLRLRYGQVRSWSHHIEHISAGSRKYCFVNRENLTKVFFTWWHINMAARVVRSFAESEIGFHILHWQRYYHTAVIGWQLMFIDSLVHWLRCGFLLEMVPWASFVFETWLKWNQTWWSNNSKSHSNCYVTWATKVLMWALTNLWWSILGKWGQLWMPPAQYVTQPK